MKTYHWNGEYWYSNSDTVLSRMVRWLVWMGGWETHRELKLDLLTPVSLLGHRFTIFGHWLDMKIPAGWLIVNWRDKHAYISSNGTPDRAHIWLWGAPPTVRIAAETHAQHKAQQAAARMKGCS